jgi:hypothetical protein
MLLPRRESALPRRVGARWIIAAFAAPVLALLAGSDATLAPAVPVFGPPHAVATVTGAGVGALTELETGDLNGDGLTDVVVTRLAFPPTQETFPVGVFLADGRGGFTDGSSIFDGPPPRTQHGRQIVIADFNGDRRNDIFVADHGFDAPPFPGFRNSLALSTPQGKLVDATNNLPPESGFSHSAAAADVDRDGDVDIYVGNLCCGDRTPPELLLNDGSGRFSRGVGMLPPEVEDPFQNRYTRSLFVDVDADGDPDLVLGAEDHTPASAVLLNDGRGHFGRVPNALPPKAFGPTSITISLATLDVDADGHADLLAGFQRADFSGRRLEVLIGNGDGTFRDETARRLPTQDEGSSWPYAIRVADVNGDGRADFGVSLPSGQSERPPLYLDDGNGVFSRVRLPVANSIFAFVDANSDRRPDLFSSFPGGSSTPERHEVQLQLVPLATPTAVRATTNLRDRIRVSWRAVTSASGYEVWRSRGRQARKLVATATAPRFDDRRAVAGVVYKYVVRATSESGKSAFSAPAIGRRRP